MMRRLLRKLRVLTALPVDNPRLLKAQYVALSRQLPLMYFVLVVNTWALAYTHRMGAPWVLTLAVPTLLTVISAVRARNWWRVRNQPPSDDVIVHALIRTNRLAVPIALVFAGWSLALFQFGDSYAQGHVAFFMAITVIVCIFCLMHLRPAALATTGVVNTMFVVFFCATGNPVFIATAVNVTLVSIGMLVVLNHHYAAFTSLVNAQAETEKLSDENLLLANLDSLTGLPNRRHFFTSLKHALAQARAQHLRLAVGILDLDGFKPVNDLYGHGVGDLLLVQVGERLQRLAGGSIQVARLGGDEFALILTDGRDDMALQAFGQQMCSDLRTTFMVTGVPIQIGGSLGVATFPDMADSAAQIFEYADYALYQSKRDHKGSMALFTRSHHEQLHREAMTEQALRRADLEAEFYVVFQPIIDSRNGRTVAFEALARWNSPELGAVPPVRFIAVAEHIGMINRLTLPLLAKALAAARQWPVGMRLSFNLSAHDCGSAQSVQRIIETILASDFNPGCLDLEITETAIMQDIVQVQRAIGHFRELGCGISLDDFGTGYSSLSQLHALALTKLKIDRSFVTDLQSKPASYKIVKSLVALSQDMALECIVEGVETEEELAALRSLGCTLVQGYLFSKPVALAQTLEWLERVHAL